MKKLILIGLISIFFIGCASSGYSTHEPSYNKCDVYTGETQLKCIDSEIQRLKRQIAIKQQQQKKCPYENVAVWQWVAEGDPTGIYMCQQYKMYNN